MRIEWSETEGLKLAGVVKAAIVAGGALVQRRVDGRSEPRRGQEGDVRVYGGRIITTYRKVGAFFILRAVTIYRSLSGCLTWAMRSAPSLTLSSPYFST